MQYTKLIALALAVIGAEANIAFTKTPGSMVQAGQPFTIQWDGATGNAPVSIFLKQGDPDNLATIALITGNGENGSYTWTPSVSLPNGDNYALEISQGTGYDESNYSGEFAITGGATGTSAASTAAATSSGSSSSSSGSGAGGAGGIVVTVTSGSSTYLTTEPAAMATGSGTGTMVMTTGYSNATATGSNSTLHHTSRTPTGFGATSTVVSTAPASTTTASHTANMAPHLVGSMGGLAAFLMGAVALL